MPQRSLSVVSYITMFFYDDFLLSCYETISALSNWEVHSSATEGEARCEVNRDNCPFMGKMPGLVKISLGGVNNN